MAETTRCPSCRANLPPNAPAGLCPACLLGQVLVELGEGSSHDDSTGAHVSALAASKVEAVYDGETKTAPPPSHEAPISDPSFPPAEQLIGPYRIIRPLGAGGMGAVFEARQERPVRRTVALKIIRPGTDTDQVIARFEAERQALAMMEHPNIAKVLDVGSTAGGQPYFVMEVVEGIPITQFCTKHQLGFRQRLELFVPVCQAIQHAHQKGVIHRDIKPSNVLVATFDGRAVPKVIDFGLAKAIGRPLTENAGFTGFGAIVGTLPYMSPEQAGSSLDVDTRTDVYALGALLYELLTGTTPLARERLNEMALTDVLRAIREDEPPRPSVRLAQARDAPGAVSSLFLPQPEKLKSALREELDWVVMKALDKERGRRYASAAELATEIGRYLAGEPVEARPPSRVYRLRKFLRRHRAGVAIAALLLFALAALALVFDRFQSRAHEVSPRIEPAGGGAPFRARAGRL